jgi:hypothetical protein
LDVATGVAGGVPAAGAPAEAGAGELDDGGVDSREQAEKAVRSNSPALSCLIISRSPPAPLAQPFASQSFRPALWPAVTASPSSGRATRVLEESALVRQAGKN